VESRKYTTVLSDGTRNIIRAMNEFNVKRFICMSSAGILGDDAGFWFGKIIMPCSETGFEIRNGRQN